MATPRLYDDLAWLWPVLSPPGDYVGEAATIDALLAEHFGDGPRRLLELGVGGGHTLLHLLEVGAERSLAYGGWGGEHAGVAVDRSEAMLERCRALIPGVDARVGDMRDVRLGERFDAVLIHDAIDYLTTVQDVRRTLATVCEHLRPGGLAMIAPTYTVETFEPGDVAEDTPPLPAQGEFGHEAVAERGVQEVCYQTRLSAVAEHPATSADPTGCGTFAMTLTYRLTFIGGGVETIEDRHRCGLFARERWVSLMAEAGLSGGLVEEGAAGDGGAWALFVGTKGP